MKPLDAVLKLSGNSRMSRVIAGGATAAMLFVSPVMGTLAAPGSSSAPAAALFQDDDETKIVPRGSGTVDEEDSSEEDVDVNEDDQVNDDDVSEEDENGSGEPADDEDYGDEQESDQGDQIFLTGIVSSKIDLNPNQWMGALDERLVKPFAVAPRPVRLSSDAIDLDAEITPREIVNGEMQTPKDEFEVTWYKDTANPGEKSNMVFAGHLNWYGVPKAVFHNINELEKGDEIVVKGENGVDYIYRVKWVQLVPTATADLEEIVGPTKKASLTLITCGGEWDPTVSLYKDRTVVRAELVKTTS